MNDTRTRQAYASNAASYSDEWASQPAPTDMYELLPKYFVLGGTVADIGCGNGRDAAWLAQQGYLVNGYDSSSEMIEIARAQFPALKFSVAQLPSLIEIIKQFDNVVCETVIMHLPSSQIGPAVERLKSLLNAGGVLYLSWRVTEGANDVRHNDGRLYSAFDASLIRKHFRDDQILHFEDVISASSGKRICRLIATRS